MKYLFHAERNANYLLDLGLFLCVLYWIVC